MNSFGQLATKKSRTEADLEALCSVVECEHYSREMLRKCFAAKNKIMATAHDILSEKSIDADSRLQAFFALDFLSEKEAMQVGLDLTEQMLSLLGVDSQLKKQAELAIERLRSAAEGDAGVALQSLETQLRKGYEKLEGMQEGLVFEALLKPFDIEMKLVPAAVAGCARTAAAWQEEKEKSRLGIAIRQLEYLQARFEPEG